MLISVAYSMRSAPEPKDEKARLEALYQYDILDTDAEDVFDDFIIIIMSMMMLKC